MDSRAKKEEDAQESGQQNYNLFRDLLMKKRLSKMSISDDDDDYETSEEEHKRRLSAFCQAFYHHQPFYDETSRKAPHGVKNE